MINPISKLNTCGCCEGIEFVTPADIDNDHGLAALLYRIGTHGMFKESMLRGLSDSAMLKELTTRENDDATVALIDAWALILDILTFYNERIINEGYILTSQERLSLLELARHISYIPKPGVAAGTYLAFSMDESPGAPTEANIPVPTRAQSIPAQDEKAQVFENIVEILAKTSWNNIRPLLSEKQAVEKGVTSLYIAGTDAQLKAGDKLLFVGNERLETGNLGSEQWDFRTVREVEINDEENYTQIFWREGLGHYDPPINPADDPKVFVFRQRAFLFGYNAPDYRTMSDDVKKSFNGTGWKTDTEWDGFTISSVSDKIIYLDSLYTNILTNSWLVLTHNAYVELYQAKKVEESAQTNFALASKSSKIVLDTDENLEIFQRRKTVVWAQSEELTIAKAPVLRPVYGNVIELDQSYPDLMEDQHLIISGELATHLQVTSREYIAKKAHSEFVKYDELLFYPKGSTLGMSLETGTVLEIVNAPEPLKGNKTKWFVKLDGKDGYVIGDPDDLIPLIEENNTSVSEIPSSLNQPQIVSELIEIREENPDKLILKDSLEHVYLRHTVTINANIAHSTHGETKVEILGSGNASIAFQKFNLKQKPLCYISSASPSGIASTLEIRVDDILWEEVPTFYGRTSEERIFISRIEDDGTVYVQFGDGITGARLPTGVENVTATYRVGTGMEGLLKSGQLSLLLDSQLGVKSVNNPLDTSGAEDPESAENIRYNAPLTVLTLDRIVSIQDYENFASAFAGIGKARADLLWKGEDRTLHLTVAGANEGAIDDTLKENLENAIDGARHNNYPVVINSFDLKQFKLKAKILLHPDYLEEKVKSAVKEALIESFQFSKRAFAQSVAPSEVISIIQSVEGVVAVDLDELDGLDPYSKEHFLLTSKRARWETSHIEPAELLLIDEQNIEIELMDQ